jgi:hypothetical protein
MARPDPDVDRWLSECCSCCSSFRIRAVDLQVSWRCWCSRHDRDPGCSRHFVDQLERRGYSSVHDGERVLWIACLHLAPAAVDRERKPNS